MYTCANCGVVSCYTDPQKKGLPKNCPMRDEETMKASLAGYDDYREFFIASSVVEAQGYGRWPRVRETVEFCKEMGYKKIGLAFCSGLQQEAKVIAGIFREHGLQVVSAICKNGGTPKEEMGIPPEHLIRPGTFEAICNPIGQAMLLNGERTEFNVVVGLCVGHDSLFLRHAEALSTVLIVKDRALANNPAGAVYCAEGYMRSRLAPDAE